MVARRPDGWRIQPDSDSVRRDVAAGTRCAACRMPLGNDTTATVNGHMHHVCAVREGFATVDAKELPALSRQDLFGE